jgi:hypothetical protein
MRILETRKQLNKTSKLITICFGCFGKGVCYLLCGESCGVFDVFG